MNKKQADYLHQLKMEELAYERETLLIIEQYKDELANKPKQELPQYTPPQPNYFPQNPQYIGPTQITGPQQQEESNLTPSQKKYGGKGK